MSSVGEHRPRVLVCLTGSVATVKWPKLVLDLCSDFDVRVVCTSHGEHFFEVAREYDAAGFKQADAAGFTSGPPLLWRDEHEWAGYKSVRSDPVVHIELRNWADLLLIAPASANTLAKVANGLADGLVSCVARAWPFGPGAGATAGPGPGLSAARVAKPVLLAPAMNTAMWQHPVTSRHLEQAQAWGMRVIPPVSKVLACGEEGTGAMAEVGTIVQAVREELLRQHGV